MPLIKISNGYVNIYLFFFCFLTLRKNVWTIQKCAIESFCDIGRTIDVYGWEWKTGLDAVEGIKCFYVGKQGCKWTKIPFDIFKDKFMGARGLTRFKKLNKNSTKFTTLSLQVRKGPLSKINHGGGLPCPFRVINYFYIWWATQNSES